MSFSNVFEEVFFFRKGAFTASRGVVLKSCRFSFFSPFKTKHKIHSRDDGSVGAEKRPECKNFHNV